MKPEEKVSEILKRLKKLYGSNPGTVLKFNNVFELLTATILSAQATDIQTNRVTERLFKKYKSVNDYARADIESLEKDVSSINFYKTKARHIKACAEIIVKKYNSVVPGTMEELLTLPGVARKTANIVLSNAYGVIEGIAVDTHVKRLAGRLGLTKSDDPVKIEKDLMAVTPKSQWGNISSLLIFHGRAVCTAREPRHDECVLRDICPSRDIGF